MNNKIGVQVNFSKGVNLTASFKNVIEMDITSCQLCIWDESMLTKEYADQVNEAVAATGIEITTVWAGWDGPCEWNFTDGPATIGLVPPAYRYSRLCALKKASEFARMIGVKKVVTHVGFIPENPDDPNFTGTVAALRDLCRFMSEREQYFLFETGQETPVTMLRTIQAIGMDNVGINFDTANLILYGKANTLDALDVFGQYVMETHIKDGLYPTDGMQLGAETPAGQGKANLPAVIKKLGELGYTGTLTIEREITGDQQKKDIAMARDLLKQWMAEA
ncbi:MAG: sugar phosphate isomerase/epimerase [Ruminococcaceae bacterium]|nr:sugar phosphate isomerase/epimerase [Oscillospiraceae bacterium]